MDKRDIVYKTRKQNNKTAQKYQRQQDVTQE
jgi:hypothetical protein